MSFIVLHVQRRYIKCISLKNIDFFVPLEKRSRTRSSSKCASTGACFPTIKLRYFLICQSDVPPHGFRVNMECSLVHTGNARQKMFSGQKKFTVEYTLELEILKT